jgi:hypothetical protein
LDHRFAAVDKKMEEMFAHTNKMVNAVYNLLDDRIKHEDIDNTERAAMSAQLTRHDTWIHQLADETHTDLL